MKRILIITADLCDDEELLYPYYRVIEEGFIPTIASFERTVINAKYHFSIAPDITVDEINLRQSKAYPRRSSSAPFPQEHQARSHNRIRG